MDNVFVIFPDYLIFWKLAISSPIILKISPELSNFVPVYGELLEETLVRFEQDYYRV
jgi:hypothetical protein